MDLREVQRRFREFERERGWHLFPASQVFVHLVEELGEIGNYILHEEGYKKAGLGHEGVNRGDLGREFAQAFALFIQLANHFDVDLESAVLEELSRMEKRFPVEKWRRAMGLGD